MSFDRDHRLLGQEQDLFHLQEEAPGMVFWHPRGWQAYRALEEAVRRRMRKDGYLEVRTPQILRRPIWEASSHWQNHASGMFVVDGEQVVSVKEFKDLIEKSRPGIEVKLEVRRGDTLTSIVVKLEAPKKKP